MSFRDIRGQDRAIEIIQEAVKSGKLSHAYLFTGPESIGKALTARTLVKALNCENGTIDSCDECHSCRKIDKDIHPDVKWIKPEGRGDMIRIEKIRQLKSDIGLKPFESRRKFYIIEGAHQMNGEAANSLLKTLEEPPPSAILILISEKPERLFYTIRSRCQKVTFKPMSLNKLERILNDKYGVSGDYSRFLARFSSGRIGKALALKGRDALAWKNQVIDGFTKEDVFFNDESLFFDRDKKKILEMLDILAIWYRDVLVLKSSNIRELVINQDRLDDAESVSGQYSQEHLLDILEEIKKSSLLIRQNVNPKLALSLLASRVEARNA